jgi:uncharacterized MAPEG superfamily protein
MNPEIKILAFAALLQVAQLLLVVLFTDLQFGLKHGVGPRDTPHPLTGVGARLDRALTNHYAALALFTIAVLTVTLALKSSPLTITCAWVYLAARVAYVPLYISGIPWLRSIAWTIGLGATVIMLFAVVIQ